MSAVWLPFNNGAADNADGIGAGQKLMELPIAELAVFDSLRRWSVETGRVFFL
jgi:hypothetical protein